MDDVNIKNILYWRAAGTRGEGLSYSFSSSSHVCPLQLPTSIFFLPGTLSVIAGTAERGVVHTLPS